MKRATREAIGLPMGNAYEFCRDPSYLPVVFILVVGLVVSIGANIILLARREKRG
jgi:hypothetical protein